MNYLYTVWFRNNTLQPDEQDYEWPACILIDAESEEKAIEWGNQLANKRLNKIKTEMFLRATAEAVEDDSKEELQSVPKVKYGIESTDDQIGW
jgi:hypothetical protein